MERGSVRHKRNSDWLKEVLLMIDRGYGPMSGRALSYPLLAAQATLKGAFVQDGETVPLCGRTLEL